MPLKVGDVFAEIGLDQSGFDRGMANAENKFKAFGGRLKGIGSNMTVGVSIPLLAVGGASFKMASDLTENIGKVDIAFKQNAEQVKAWAETSLENFGIAESTALDMAGLYGDMATSMGLTTKQAAEMATTLAGRAGDMASFKNISIDIANTGLKAIFTGETESLKQLGVVMTQANLDAYALANGYGKVTKDMTETEKVLLRYNFVLDKTKNAQGNFKDTGHQAAGEMRTFGETLKELGATFGQDILPLLTPVIHDVNELLQGFADMDPTARKVILVLGVLAIATGPTLVGLGNLVNAVGSIRGGFKLLSAAQGAGSIGGLGSSLAGLAAAGGPIMLVIAAVGLLGVAWAIWGDDVHRIIGEVNRDIMTNLSTLEKAGRTNIRDGIAGWGKTTQAERKNPSVKAWEQLKGYATGGIITKPTILSDAATGVPYGKMAEERPEAITPLGEGGGTVTHVVTGEVIHKGVNNEGQLIAAVKETFVGEIRDGGRRVPNRLQIIPIG